MAHSSLTVSICRGEFPTIGSQCQPEKFNLLPLVNKANIHHAACFDLEGNLWICKATLFTGIAIMVCALMGFSMVPKAQPSVSDPGK
jgi:hypothetical protein